MMKNMKTAICLMAVALLVLARQGYSLVEYKDGGTHNISSMVNDDMWVDHDSPNMQTTVNLVTGGSVGHLQAYGSSRVGILGGEVRDGFDALGVSQVTVSSGMVAGLQAVQDSRVTVSGGTIAWWLYSCSTSQVTMSGGTVGVLAPDGSSLVGWCGGTVCEDLRLDGSAVLVITGSDFAIDGIPVGLSEIGSILGGNYLDEPFRHMTGTLANGDIVDNDFRIGSDARIVLVPEPATLSLLALGGIALRMRSRRTRSI